VQGGCLPVWPRKRGAGEGRGQDFGGGGGGGLMSGAGGGCFAVSWMQAVARDGQVEILKSQLAPEFSI